VHEFISLDGVIDAPTWTFDYGFDPGMASAIGAITARSAAILLGRTTYEMFEPAWSTRTVEDDPGAPFFNDTTKYVVSGTLTAATWRNSELLGPYDPEAIGSLKGDVDGDIYVSGSGTLVRAMLADGLVDELHLFVYPLTRGSGPRLFPPEAEPVELSLVTCESYPNGAVYLAYRPGARDGAPAVRHLPSGGLQGNHSIARDTRRYGSARRGLRRAGRRVVGGRMQLPQCQESGGWAGRSCSYSCSLPQRRSASAWSSPRGGPARPARRVRLSSCVRTPLVGAEILEAVALDAMTTDRPYRDALCREGAVDEILGENGGQFDPRVVGAFATCEPRLHRLHGEFANVAA
jgi:dihydrofolate reductase